MGAVVAPELQATGALSFSGEEYGLLFSICRAEPSPVIADVQFMGPGPVVGRWLAGKRLHVRDFDVAARTLGMSYDGGDGIAPFELQVHGDNAVMRIQGRSIKGQLDWSVL